VVDKPAGWTSHDVVARTRRIFGQRRVGHSGTLDPGATGVLVVGLGRATRLLRFLTELPKHYEGEIVLGVSTTTLDDEGEETGRWDLTHVTEAEVRAAAAALTGEIMQVPPMVSAVRVGGRRLHELAREGVEVARQPRPVTVRRLDVEPSSEPGVWRAHVVCSSGTFVRVLAADLGAALGGGAHLRHLRRTAIGSFQVSEARTLEQLEAAPLDALLTPAEALRDYPALAVDATVASEVGHGRPLPAAILGAGGRGPWAVHDHAGALLAVYEVRGAGDQVLYPAVVLAGSESSAGD